MIIFIINYKYFIITFYARLIKKTVMKYKLILLNKHTKWDSLMHVKIILKLEKTFKININEKIILNLQI